jgi:hypothetical protein
MTIDDLLSGSTAYFYQRDRRITKLAIRELFWDLRESVTQPARDLFRHERVELGDAFFSAVCFSYKRAPAFIRPTAGIFDTVHGFLMIVEKANFIAVIKAGLELPSGFKTRFLKPAGRGRVESAVATVDAKFEQVALRGMSASKQALRAKTLEASDLENSMPMASASRFITKRFRVRRDDGHFAATPSTGRIAMRSDRAGYETLVQWAGDVIDQLGLEGTEVAPFIRNFARSVDLESLPVDTVPTYVAIDVPDLTDRLFGDMPSIRFVTIAGENVAVPLDKAETEAILSDLDNSFPLRMDTHGLHVRSANDLADVGALKLGKTRIALSALRLASMEGVLVESVDANGQDTRELLRRYLDNEDLFLVLFSDPSLAYLNGEAFRDQAMLDGGAEFMRHILANPALASASSEKGTFDPAATQFSANSVFRILADHLAPEDDVLVCDDLGDEWADFIGLNTDQRRPSISFYHAKHGALSLGASPFHISVSQAEKNLGRLPLSPTAMAQKYEAWNATYNGPNVATSIQRIIRGGDIAAIAAHAEAVRTSPEVSKRMVIVTSSLSRAAVAAEFAAVAAGKSPSAHFVQLYWLLTSYFSACAEVGAVGYILCQP